MQSWYLFGKSVPWMNKTTYEQELKDKGFLLYTTVGRSMRPFLRSGEDLMRIEAVDAERCKKYDAVLYRRDSGKYVLHRIVKVRERDYILCGDNCWQKEPGIRHDQILGVLTQVIRDGKPLPVSDPAYRRRVRLWWFLYPLRAAVLWCRDMVYYVRKKLQQRPV